MTPLLAVVTAAIVAMCQVAVPLRERLVVATFEEHGVPAGMGDVVSDMVIRAIDAPGYELLERRQVRRVLEEQAFATSDLTQPGEAVRYGRLADTRFVLVGTVYRLDGVYLVSARMVDSETGIVRESARAVVQFRTVDEMAAKVGELARLLGLRVGPPFAQEPTPAPASPDVARPAAVPATAPAADRPDASTVRDLLERVGDAVTSPLPVSVATPGRTIMSGNPVPLRIRSDRDGFLSLFVVDADGSVRMLLPNARTERFRVRAGQSVSIPGDLPFTLRAAPPAGVTRIRAVVTDEAAWRRASCCARCRLLIPLPPMAVRAHGWLVNWSSSWSTWVPHPRSRPSRPPLRWRRRPLRLHRQHCLHRRRPYRRPRVLRRQFRPPSACLPHSTRRSAPSGRWTSPPVACSDGRSRARSSLASTWLGSTARGPHPLRR
jgi:hypothetical protein